MHINYLIMLKFLNSNPPIYEGLLRLQSFVLRGGYGFVRIRLRKSSAVHFRHTSKFRVLLVFDHLNLLIS